jgi:EAL domain-containing protein (putative c-di-GMP-specific phosphodiesterase class I)
LWRFAIGFVFDDSRQACVKRAHYSGAPIARQPEMACQIRSFRAFLPVNIAIFRNATYRTFVSRFERYSACNYSRLYGQERGMLLIASEATRGSQALNDVVREMSFSLSFFSSVDKLAELMVGESRRVVLLAADDINESVITCLKAAVGRAPFGVIVAADRVSMSASEKARLLESLVELPNVEWVGPDYNYERLAASARYCRRRMLKLSRKDLEAAFENFEFVVRYQPKVERNAGTEWLTREAEALVRWRHPELGLIGPLEFLPEVEAFGQMDKLTEFVLRKSAGQLASWREQGLALNCCVNLAPSLLTDKSIADRYADIVTEFGIECASFTFEVVEQDLTNPDAPHLRTINRLRKRGFRLCLDDFRVAAASLGTFEKLPFDEIKIHASAIRRAQSDTVKMSVLAAVTGLAHNLGMSVCAEGVEDQETFDFLKTIECDKMQGFLISEAVLPHIIRRVYSARQDDMAEDVA